MRARVPPCHLAQVADHVADHAGLSAAQHAVSAKAGRGAAGLLDALLDRALNNKLMRRVLAPQLVARVGRCGLASPGLGLPQSSERAAA